MSKARVWYLQSHSNDQVSYGFKINNIGKENNIPEISSLKQIITIA
jgi:hypothetical protein